MHISNVSSPLESSFRALTAKWQNALRHFQRSLLECGSNFEVEHSQRLGLLFSKKVGKTKELLTWAALFDSESIPACSMMLKALVFHNHWESAMRLFESTSDTRSKGELGENLAQFLMSRNLWEQSLQIVSHLAQFPTPSETAESTNVAVHRTPSSSLAELPNDTVGLATDPNYVPYEERTGYCGLGSAVFRAYPKNSQWADAIAALEKLKPLVDPRTQARLEEFALVRRVYGAKQYEKALETLSEGNVVHSSGLQQRTLLFAALRVEDTVACVSCLERLANLGDNQVPSVSLTAVCRRVVAQPSVLRSRRDALRFGRIACLCGHRIRDSAVRKQVGSLLEEMGIPCGEVPRVQTTVTEKLLHAAQEELTAPLIGRNATVTELDNAVSVLAAHGQWKEALDALNSMTRLSPRNEEERVILKVVRENHGDWEKALLFFA